MQRITWIGLNKLCIQRLRIQHCVCEKEMLFVTMLLLSGRKSVFSDKRQGYNGLAWGIRILATFTKSVNGRQNRNSFSRLQGRMEKSLKDTRQSNQKLVECLKEMNATSISLIPKVANPTRLTDFRPISCWQYSIQMHREDSSWRMKELMKGYHTTMGPARCAMKVDLMKAYDSVRWDFVDATLIKMGFPRTVIDWINGAVLQYECQPKLQVPLEMQEGQNFSSLLCRRLDDIQQRGCTFNPYDQKMYSQSFRFYQVYWASLFLLPGEVVKNVEQIMRSFLWSGSDMSTTRAKVAWDQMAQSGSTWIRSNLLRGRNFWTIKAPGSCSWAWGKILKLRSLAWPKMKHVIGDGMTTSLWFDNWHPHSPLADTYGERFIYDSDHNHLFFECSFAKALWWNVCDRCDIPRMTKAWMNGFDWPLSLGMEKVSSTFLVNWVFAATVYCIWQERNARIFADVSKTSNLVFDQIECIIRDKLVLMRNVQQTDENIRIQRLWRVNNMDS
ncbi:hypothetical protein D5086_006284 [Populus alba]|uniref:Uncharacterized protein n=1 Tax=Populus alba TaxID=43335 RepID=A0ACC4CKW9_POPAL